MNNEPHTSITLLNEAETQAELRCNRIELYRKVIAGDLPWPHKLGGIENVWRSDDVMIAKRKS